MLAAGILLVLAFTAVHGGEHGPEDGATRCSTCIVAHSPALDATPVRVEQVAVDLGEWAPRERAIVVMTQAPCGEPSRGPPLVP
jgi:hypothetical protein